MNKQWAHNWMVSLRHPSFSNISCSRQSKWISLLSSVSPTFICNELISGDWIYMSLIQVSFPKKMTAMSMCVCGCLVFTKHSISLISNWAEMQTSGIYNCTFNPLVLSSSFSQPLTALDMWDPWDTWAILLLRSQSTKTPQKMYA